MNRWVAMFLVVGVVSCLPTPGRKGIPDEGRDPGGEGTADGVAGEDVGEAGAVEGVTPGDAPEAVDAADVEVGPDEGEAGDAPDPAEEVPADDGVAEVTDLAEARACQNDEDCDDLVGPLGPCEKAVCLDGQCSITQAPAGTPCTGDGNPCTVDQCDDQGVCVHDPITCLEPPENACEEDTLVTYASPGQCDRGQCEYPKTEKECGQGCTVTDGVAHCVGEDPCAGVSCEVAPFLCVKHPGTCDQGSCVFEYDDGAACDDGDACSVGDRCAQGVCWGEPVVCDAPPEPFCQDANTLITHASPGTCVEGECEYEASPVPCDHGCEEGRDGIARCVDQDPCETLDCSVAPSPCLKSPGECVDGACVFEYADGAPCEDGDLCTLEDRCEGGVCLSGLPRVCDDQDICTDDGCDPESGECMTAYNEAPCDDGLGCTTEDVCGQGSCSGTPVVCNDPPDPECVDFQHVRTWNPDGTCEEPSGTCVYESSVTPCRSGWCQYGYCTDEGMTVVGFFEAGGGVLEGEGLSLSGTFGGWTEGGSCGDGVFVLRAGW